MTEIYWFKPITKEEIEKVRSVEKQVQEKFLKYVNMESELVLWSIVYDKEIQEVLDTSPAFKHNKQSLEETWKIIKKGALREDIPLEDMVRFWIKTFKEYKPVNYSIGI